MKTFSDDSLAAFAAGAFLSVGAVNIACAPDPVRVWGGYGAVTLGGDDFQGIGDAGLVSVTGKAIGGAEQPISLTLSGVESAVLALLEAGAIRRVPVVVWRLIFDPPGLTLLDSQVFGQGRLDQLLTARDASGTYTLTATVEGAARGAGRPGGRMRSDADQRLVATNDGGFKHISYAGTKTLNWGGKPPEAAATALSGAFQAAVGQYY